MTVRINFYSI